MYAYRPSVSGMKMGVGSLVYQVYTSGLRQGQQAGNNLGLVVGELQESPTVGIVILHKMNVFVGWSIYKVMNLFYRKIASNNFVMRSKKIRYIQQRLTYAHYTRVQARQTVDHRIE